jgi:hypothetical protein
MATISATPSGPKAASQPANDERIKGEVDVKPYLTVAAAGIGLAGVYLAHHLSKRRDRLSQFRSAAVRFREAFTPELVAAEADTNNRIDYMELLRSAYDERHARAFIIFEPFVPADKRRGLREEWDRYRYGENDDGTIQRPGPEDIAHASLYFLEYSTEWDLRSPERPRANTIKRIHKLLSYAEDA